ncbi:hypothetical protein JOF36_007837 [Pseudonocardia parietis]|uniref:DUF1440 domain-containing protein n=2 Tax=Pseudonocardia parietis TaxID=570936 RepID=A0ABS4W784_9PSEU|nr:hypothetical protein [Pseudonocardia parietis]MBP2372064.1 hypothetical protein [Pseudonocardia parietis]
MSAVLEVGQRMTSSWRQPPTLIVRTALAGGPAHKLAGEDVLAIMAHLGYGTSCGALFALLSRRGLRPSPAVGVGYGLLLWLISYAAWVPAMRAIPLPQHDCPGRQSTLIGAHVVYGVVLATTLRRLRRRSWT